MARHKRDQAGVLTLKMVLIIAVVLIVVLALFVRLTAKKESNKTSTTQGTTASSGGSASSNTRSETNEQRRRRLNVARKADANTLLYAAKAYVVANNGDRPWHIDNGQLHGPRNDVGQPIVLTYYKTKDVLFANNNQLPFRYNAVQVVFDAACSRDGSTGTTPNIAVQYGNEEPSGVYTPQCVDLPTP